MKAVARSLLGLTFAVTVLAAANAGAQPLAAGELSFRRILVPADQVEQWPRATEPYVPMEPAEFERLVELAARTAAGVPTAAAQIRSAVYELTESSPAGVAGTAQLEIAHEGDPCWLLLDPCNVAVSQPQWSGEPPAPAQLAMDSQGRLIVFVERSGTLELSWVPGARGERRAAPLHLILPRAPLNRIWLALSQGAEPVVSRGVLVAPTVDEPRWRCELGGQHELDVRWVDDKTEHRDPPRAQVRRALTYVFTPQGVELTATLSIDATGTALEEMLVEVPAPLRIVAARVGDQSLPLATSGDQAAMARSIRLPLPARSDAPTVVQLVGVASLELGSAFALPVISTPQAEPSAAHVTLVVPTPLAVEQLDARQCRQSKLTLAAGDRPGETIEFENFPPAASLELVLERPVERLSARLGCDIELGDELRGRAALDLTWPAGARSRVECLVEPGWRVETVACEPAAALADWTFDAGPGERGLLGVRLAGPRVPKGHVQLVVTARRVLAADDRDWSLGELTWLRPRHAALRGTWLRLHALAPHELSWDLPAAAIVSDRDQLEPEERGLFTGERTGPLLIVSPETAERRVSLERQPARFAAHARVEVWADGEQWVETIAIDCRLESAPIKRLLVQTTPLREANWQWATGTRAAEGLTATRLPGNAGDTLETWELSFARPQAAPVTITARRSVPAAGVYVPSLVAVPEASEQSGRLVLAAAEGVALEVANARLKAQPVELLSPSACLPAQAAFAYQPQIDLAPAPQPPLSIVQRPKSQADTAGLRVWHSRLTSQVAGNGGASHAVEYLVENPWGQRQLTVVMPAGAMVHHVFVDGRGVPRSERGDRLAVDLPADARYPRVVIEFSTREEVAGWRSAFVAPWPRPAAVEARRSTVVWFPEPWTAWPIDLAAPETTLRQRLFGPLALAESKRVQGSPAMAATGQGPWQSQWPVASLPPRGWNAFSSTGEAVFEVIDRTRWQALGWGALFVMLGLGMLVRRRWRVHLTLTVIVLLVALAVPAWLVVLTGYASLGVLLSWLANAIPVAEPAAQPIASRGSSIARLAPAATVAAMMVLVWQGGAVPTSGAQPAGVAAPVAGVLIPVDQQHRPTGQRYQVPERLAQALQRAARQRSGLADAWLYESVTYEIARPNVAMAEGGWSIRLSIDVNVLRPNSAVRILLPRGLTAEDRATIRLDGRPLVVRWDAERGEAVFDVAEAGRRRFDVEVAASRTRDAAGLELETPRFALAKLRLVGGAALVPLGPVDRLTLEADPDEAAVAADSATQVEVDQLIWLKPQASTTLANVRCRYRVLQGSVRTLTWTTDPALRLVPFTGVNSPMARSQLVRGELRLELARPMSGEFNIDLTFLLSDAGSSGVLAMPQLEPVGARLAQRRVALTLGPRYEAAGPVAASFSETNATAFLTAWGTGGAAPDLAYLANEPAALWSLPIVARRAAAATADELALDVGRHETRFRWRTAFEAPAELPFQLRAQLPSRCRVAEVSLRTAGAEHVWRWSQDRTGLLTVFLTEPLAEAATLVVTGAQELVAPGRLTFAPCRLSDLESVRRRVFVHRQPGVTVALGEANDLIPAAEAPIDPAPEGWGHLALSLAGPVEAAAVLDVQLNVPRTTWQAVQSMTHDELGWSTEIAGMLKITEGAVDSLRWVVPADWTGPYEIEPAGDIRRVASDRPTHAMIEVKFRAPLVADTKVALRGRCAPLDGKPTFVPEIHLLDIEQGERFVCLPTQAGSDIVAWETRGLAPAELPPGLSGDPAGDEGQQVYRVIDQFYGAELRPAAIETEAPIVRLTEIRLGQPGSSGVVGAACFDLVPSGLTSCRLQMPAGYHVLGIRVAETPVDASRDAHGHWHVPLASSQLPQRLEVAFRAPRWAGVSLPILAPRLIDIPLGATIWSSATTETRAKLGGAAAGDPLRADIERLQQLTQLLDQGLALCSELPPPEAARWYRPWIARWSAAQRSVEARLAAAGNGSLARETANELRLIVEEQAAQAKQAGLSDVYNAALARQWSSDDLLDVIWLDKPVAEHQQWLVAGGKPLELRLPAPAEASTRAGPRTAMAIGILSLAAWCLLGPGAPWLAEAARRWSAAWCVLIGLAWWAGLAAPWVGIALIGVGLVRAWHPAPWRRLALPTGRPSGRSSRVQRANVSVE